MHFGDIEHFEESCHKIGINIRNKDNSYKSFGKVLEEISQKFRESCEKYEKDRVL